MHWHRGGVFLNMSGLDCSCFQLAQALSVFFPVQYPLHCLNIFKLRLIFGKGCNKGVQVCSTGIVYYRRWDNEAFPHWVCHDAVRHAFSGKCERVLQSQEMAALPLTSTGGSGGQYVCTQDKGTFTLVAMACVAAVFIINLSDLSQGPGHRRHSKKS